MGTKKKDGTCVIEAYNFDQETIRTALVEATILHEFPFIIVNLIGFRKFVRSLVPAFKMVGHQTIGKDCMKIYQSELKVICDLLSKINGRICITSDMWTLNQNTGYLILTLHFVDNEWKL